jgi:hypothetical protein
MLQEYSFKVDILHNLHLIFDMNETRMQYFTTEKIKIW